MRIVEVDIQIRMPIKELGYFAFLTQCSIRQQSIFGWFTVMPAVPVAFIFRCLGHFSFTGALQLHRQCFLRKAMPGVKIYAVRLGT